MKTQFGIRCKYWVLPAIVYLIFFINKGYSQEEPHTVYPIIFVHGLIGNGDSWDSDYDIIDFLTEPESNTPLKFGGKINVSLDYNRSFLPADNTKEKDVKMLTGKNDISEGDLYIVNFDIRRDGSQPDGFKGTGEFLLSDPGKIHVNDPDLYRVGDLLRIQDEFLKIQSIQGNELTVERGLNGSTAGSYLPGLSINILNISNQSNQASIVKQGYGLKQVIDLVKDKTHAEKVILVGHSMGGLAIREYIRSYYNRVPYNNINDVAKMVTIGTPHYGSNLTKSPGFMQQWFDIDDRSDAIRDLETGIENFILSKLGIYLYGGDEKSVDDKFYSKDVNGDGDENDQIEGLNDNYSHLDEIAITYIVSKYFDANIYVGANDGVVLTESQYINPKDVIMTDRPHITLYKKILGVPVIDVPGETKDVYSLIRGLDEPNEKELAYKISEESVNKGFITYQKDNTNSDGDLYKVVLNKDGKLTVKILANGYSGIDLFQILDEDLYSKVLETNINNTIEYNALAGTYYVRIYGTANQQSWQYPYTLETQFEPVLTGLISISSSNLQFYDAVIGNQKQKIVSLTNNGETNVSITSLALTGTNASQFSQNLTTPVQIFPGTNVNITVNFNPTSTGEKEAALELTTNLPDNPVKTISIKGNGVDHETKVLAVNNAGSYNFGNTRVNTSRNKTFTIQNTGSNPCTISDLTIEGLNPDPYSIISAPALPFDLGSGQTQQVTVKFSPTSIGSKSAVLAISNNSDNISPKHSIELYGNGTENFYSGSNNNLVAFEYWFDDQYSSRVYQSVSQEHVSYLQANIPTDGLCTGLHSLHIRYKDQKEKWSSVISEYFYKLPLTSGSQRKIVACEYWFDDNYTDKTVTPITSGQTFSFDGDINPESLSPGLHSYHTRYKDDSGQWSSVVSEYFHKLPLTSGSQRKIVACEYWFDDNYAAKTTTSITSGQTFSFDGDINPESLSSGLHSYHTRYKDDSGQWSSVVSEFVYKSPISSSPVNQITSYRYWFDTNDNNISTTNLQTPENPYLLNRTITTNDLSDGNHTVHFQFKDSRQLWSSVVTDTIEVTLVAESHFTPVWTGNGVDQMSFNVVLAKLDGTDLQASDEIAVFDGTKCVGVGKLNSVVSSQNALTFVASKDDGTGNGYTAGNPITFRIWDLSQQKEYMVSATYLNEQPTWSTSGKYEANATCFVEINAVSQTTQTISLSNGWNILSANVLPENKDLMHNMQPLIDGGKLVKVQDERGKTVENWGIFGGWKNQVGDMAAPEGYKVKVNADCSLELTGVPTQLPSDIDLSNGWNIVSFPHTAEVNGSDVVQALVTVGTLVKVQDEKGQTIENWGIFGGWKNLIGNFKPGEGYKVKVNQDTKLTINSSYTKSTAVPVQLAQTEHFAAAFTGNGIDHIDINLVDLPESILEPGDEIAVFDNGLCVGSVKITERNLKSEAAQLIASANDQNGSLGFTEGNKIELKLWKQTTGNEYNLPVEFISGSTTFKKHESSFASLKNSATGLESSITENKFSFICYPNPTDGVVTIQFSIKPKRNTLLQLFDLNGKKLMERIISSRTEQLNLNKFDEGIYYIMINTNDTQNIQKIILN